MRRCQQQHNIPHMILTQPNHQAARVLVRTNVLHKQQQRQAAADMGHAKELLSV